MQNWKALLAGSALGMGLLTAAGCHIDTHKNGNNEDVKIATPFGGLSVKTNDEAVKESVGLAIYPGATLLRKSDKDKGAADVDIGFGGFRLRVQELGYETADAPDKVIAFYRNDMARFGTVILCRDDIPVGLPDHTPDGLTCEHDRNSRKHIAEDRDGEELKAGSKQRQHIVEINTLDSGTKIRLIVLELPGNLGTNPDKQ